MDNHINPHLGRKRVWKLSADDVQAFIRIKLDEGLSTRTVRLMRSVLVQVLNYAMSRGRVPRNVAAITQGPKLTSQRESRDLSADEAKILIKALDGERLEAMYLLRLTTGIRQGQGFGLPWTHLDLEAGKMRVSQALSRQPGGNVIADGKTHRRGWRTIPLAPPVVEALKAHKERQDEERKALGEAWQDNGLVFCTPIGTPLDPDNERKAFYTLLDRAGLGHLTPNELAILRPRSCSPRASPWRSYRRSSGIHPSASRRTCTATSEKGSDVRRLMRSLVLFGSKYLRA